MQHPENIYLLPNTFRYRAKTASRHSLMPVYRETRALYPYNILSRHYSVHLQRSQATQNINLLEVKSVTPF